MLKTIQFLVYCYVFRRNSAIFGECALGFVREQSSYSVLRRPSPPRKYTSCHFCHRFWFRDSSPQDDKKGQVQFSGIYLKWRTKVTSQFHFSLKWEKPVREWHTWSLIALVQTLATLMWSYRSQWPRDLRRKSAVTRLLRFWVRIPAEGMNVCSLRLRSTTSITTVTLWGHYYVKNRRGGGFLNTNAATNQQLIRTARTLEAEWWQVCWEAQVRGKRKMSQVLAAFGLLDFTLLRSVLTWRAFWNMYHSFLLIFQFFFCPR